MKIEGKTWVVTGGGNGLGRELTLQLLNQGAKVAAVDLREEALLETTKLAGDLSVNLSTHVLNVTDREAVYVFAEEVTARFGAVDGIINNAGIIQPFVPVEQLSFEQIERVMNVNFFGTLYFTKAFLPYLLQRPEAHIVNIASMGGFMPFPKQTIYGASKAAVKLLTEGLYAELMQTNVNVSVVFPGGIGTDVTKNSGVEMKTQSSVDEEKMRKMILTPAKAAELVLKGVKKNKLRIYAGKDSNSLHWLYRLAPTFATKFISNQMRKNGI